MTANKQLAMCWADNIQNNGQDCVPSNDDDIEERKGGAEKARAKNKKLLLESSAKCPKLTDMFKIKKTEITDKISKTESLVLVETESSIAMVETESSEIFAVEKNTNIIFFSKPKSCNLDLFFDYHPKQPYEEVPFKPKKAYYRPDNTQRQWLSYNSIKKALYCSVCIVFCPHSNAFTEGMITWSHTYQRIDEHENSKDHTDAAEAYFLNSTKKNIDFLLFSKQKSLRKEHIKHNRQILERIIDVVKLIGKRGLSYRGNQSESAYMLDSLSTDHGNFLDILLLLGKYDIHLNDHLKTIIEKSKKAHESGSKGRGGLITFISKTTLNVIIDSISCIIKNKISDAVREAGMYSVEIDTTQDISVMDQCAVVIRFVDKNCVKVNEKLIAIVECSIHLAMVCLNCFKLY
ncbi:hypothetical protein QTP88_013413 [Uroleucon formosanum]